MSDDWRLLHFVYIFITTLGYGVALKELSRIVMAPTAWGHVLNSRLDERIGLQNVNDFQTKRHGESPDISKNVTIEAY